MYFPEIDSLKIKHLITVTYETQKATLELKLFDIVPNKNGLISAIF